MVSICIFQEQHKSLLAISSRFSVSSHTPMVRTFVSLKYVKAAKLSSLYGVFSARSSQYLGLLFLVDGCFCICNNWRSS